MKLPIPSLVLVLASTLAPVPAFAGLVVQSIEVFVDAHLNLGAESRIAGDYDPQGYAQPYALSASVDLEDLRATAFQNKGGFFHDRANITFPWGSAGSANADSRTGYVLIVSTDTPDTPLMLDFHYYGTRLDAHSYYAGGTLEATAWASIRAGRVNAGTPAPLLSLPEVWSVDDTIRLAPGTQSLFMQDSLTVDTHGVGTPDTVFRNGWEEFRSFGSLERAEFDGHIDFGVLQPGEWFVLSYSGFAAVEGVNVPYAAGGQALVSDPFGLSSGQAPLRLAGVELPQAPDAENAVPEPAPLALFAGGIAAAAVLSVRRRPSRRGRPGRAFIPAASGACD